jgi:hypothetical protein
MKREEAISCLKEISEVYINASAVTLSLSKPTEESIGYQLQIKTLPALADIDTIKHIIKKRKLKLREENESIIIYEPRE